MIGLNLVSAAALGITLRVKPILCIKSHICIGAVLKIFNTCPRGACKYGGLSFGVRGLTDDHVAGLVRLSRGEQLSVVL
jgi:hypothetical protein